MQMPMSIVALLTRLVEDQHRASSCGVDVRLRVSLRVDNHPRGTIARPQFEIVPLHTTRRTTRAPRSVQPIDANARSPHKVEDVSELLFAVERGLGASSEKRISKIRGELIRAGYFRKDAVPATISRG